MKQDLAQKIAQDLVKKIEIYEPETVAKRIGHITQVQDGVVKISGLPQVMYFELLSFPGNLLGVAINLEEDSIGAIILGDYLTLKEGDEVKSTGKLLSVPVSDKLIGRVIDALGHPLDGKGEVRAKTYNPLEKIAPGVTTREPVNTPLQTGIKAVDALVPIGRGQRELIIGDRNTGKTAVAIDTIINQKQENVICIYVAIGQKTSRVAHVVADLEKYKAMNHTIVVSATASDPASMQYLAPYGGCAIAEYFMSKGKDVLIIYDDLSKHAWAYRQISLVLRRPSGREAFPGDVFYLHSKLLERACKLNKKHGGGSITALPIIETLANDLSAYIPTNVISITDGQIFLESDLFNAGQRPAINVGQSVSRVGGSAQVKAMKNVAGNMRLDLAQYRELAAFAQFSSDLDEATKKQIDRGARMLELLKQGQFAPLSMAEQVVVMWAGVKGYLDNVAVKDVTTFEKQFLEYMHNEHEKVISAITKDAAVLKKTEELLNKAIEKYLESFTISKNDSETQEADTVEIKNKKEKQSKKKKT